MAAPFSSKQWVVIGSAAVLFVLLFFVNRKPPKTEGSVQPQAGHANRAMSIDSIIEEAKAQVPLAIKERINKIEGAIAASSKELQVKLLDSIVNLYDSIGAQLPASSYLEKLGGVKNSTDIWYEAGDSYYKCALVVNNNARVPILQRAMQCFDNSLKADSTNLQAKVGKGECIVEGGGQPMEGIKMIESVLKQDSVNEKAQIALGTFSIQSGQYPKAIVRFKKVLKEDPSFTEAYLYLAQASEGAGDKSGAIGYLKKYSTFARDSVVKIQVDNYIKKLEGDTNGTK